MRSKADRPVTRKRTVKSPAPKRLRRRRRRVINYRRIVPRVLMLVLGIVLAIILLNHPYFHVSQQTVIVRGNRTVSTPDIRSRVQLPSDANFFLLRTGPISKRILDNPMIKQVRIYRVPPKTLVISVVERTPSFLLCSGASTYEVDGKGVPYCRLIPTADTGAVPASYLEVDDKNRPYRSIPVTRKNIPTVTYTPKTSPVLGRPIEDTPFLGSMEALRDARKEGLAGAGKISVDLSGELCLNVQDKYEVRLGQPKELSKKLKTAVRAIRDLVSEQNIEYIDVGTLDAPAYKSRGGAKSPVP